MSHVGVETKESALIGELELFSDKRTFSVMEKQNENRCVFKYPRVSVDQA